MWHCPHCGALQAEAARCWVCRRSSTTCSTCRSFRRSLATDVGYCSLDRRRRPLTGLELRGCWVGRPAAVEGSTETPRASRMPLATNQRAFIPLDDVGVRVATEPTLPAVPFVEAIEAPTSLFGDADR